MERDGNVTPSSAGESKPSDHPAEARARYDAGDAASRLRPEYAPPDRNESAAPKETEVWSGRTHWKHFIGVLTVWFVLNAGAGLLLAFAGRRVEWLGGRTALITFGVFLLVTSVELVGRRVVWRILQKRFRLTTERLFIETGVLSRTIDQTELIRVDDVRVHKSVMDRVFGLGTVEVMSTDATHGGLLIAGIRESDRVAEAIRTQMRVLRRKSLYVENL